MAETGYFITRHFKKKQKGVVHHPFVIVFSFLYGLRFLQNLSPPLVLGILHACGIDIYDGTAPGLNGNISGRQLNITYQSVKIFIH